MTALILLKDFLETQVELWKPIDGFTGYEISNLGRVRSYWCKSGSGKSGGLFPSGKHRGSWTYVLGNAPAIRVLGTDKDGYKNVTLQIDGKSYLRRVHRLVLQAFAQNHRPKTAIFVNHKNNIKYDNRLPNLNWCTQRENEDHARAIGVWPRGVKHGMARLSEDDVRAIRVRYADGDMQSSIARDYGCTPENIGHIVHRRLWKQVA